MDINNIKVQYETLNKDLKQALSRMERTDKVFIIREAIKEDRLGDFKEEFLDRYGRDVYERAF